MRKIEDLGALFLGTRLKRLSDMLFDEVDRTYTEQGIELNSRVTALLFLLQEHGDAGVMDMASSLGITHPAVNQMSKKLISQGYIQSKPDEKDERRRLLSLTETGNSLVSQLHPIWRQLTCDLENMLLQSEHALLEAIMNLEQQNAEQPLSERIGKGLRHQLAQRIEIVPFSTQYKDDFKRLNVEWLEKYFYVEEYDNKVLSNPEQYIIGSGGDIYFALLNGEAVGTVALMHDDKNHIELTKMAVTDKHQGLGIGRKLMEFAIAQYQQSNAELLFLESNSKLKPALHLYEKMGFVHKEKLETSVYQRSDVYMEYVPPRT